MRPPQAIDIWSVPLGKHVGKIAAEGAALPKPLAFVEGSHLLTSGTSGGNAGTRRAGSCCAASKR
jgi:hypothetical protein